MAYTYDFPRPMVSADAVIFARDEQKELFVLLIQRGNEPFKGKWAFPGGFMDMDESLETTVIRELEEETGITGVPLMQFHTFSKPGRDPRGRTVSTAFIGLVQKEGIKLTGGDDAADAKWFHINEIPPLAFDHDEVFDSALRFLRSNYQIRPETS